MEMNCVSQTKERLLNIPKWRLLKKIFRDKKDGYCYLRRTSEKLNELYIANIRRT